MNNKLVTCVNTSHKGDGYFANVDIKNGTLILSEKIVICVRKERKYPIMSLWLIYLVYHNKKLKQKFFQSFVPHEIDSQCRSRQTIISMTSHIDVPRLKTFFATLNVDEIILAYEKIKRNCFDCDGKFFIAFDGTKFNHACNANVDYYFDKDTNILSFYSNRDISQGEELTIQYVSPLIAKSSLYYTYGFNCDCEICKQK